MASSSAVKNGPVSSARRSSPLSVAIEKRASHRRARVRAGEDLLDQVAGELGGHLAHDLAVDPALLPQLRRSRPRRAAGRCRSRGRAARRGRRSRTAAGSTTLKPVREGQLGVDGAVDRDDLEVERRRPARGPSACPRTTPAGRCRPRRRPATVPVVGRALAGRGRSGRCSASSRVVLARASRSAADSSRARRCSRPGPAGDSGDREQRDAPAAQRHRRPPRRAGRAPGVPRRTVARRRRSGRGGGPCVDRARRASAGP